MQILNVVKKYQEKLEEEIVFYERYIANAPDGQLKVIRNCNRFKWFVLNEDGHKSYIQKSNEDLAIKLALKSYYKRKLKVMYRKKKATERYLERMLLVNDDPKQLLINSEEFSRLVSLGKGDRSDYIESWIKQEFESNPNHPEYLTVKTVNGLYVRSKSEAYIAAELAEHAIPFRYECKINLCGIDFYPDFTILNPLTEEVVLWEHLGMVDDDTYLNNALSKIRLYIKAGFIPSKNLILTSETKDEPLDFSVVKDLIKIHFE